MLSFERYTSIKRSTEFVPPLLSFADVPPTDSSDYPGFCPEEAQSSVDEHFFWIPYKAYCYKFFTETEIWSDACSGCVQHGESFTGLAGINRLQLDT